MLERSEVRSVLGLFAFCPCVWGSGDSLSGHVTGQGTREGRASCCSLQFIGRKVLEAARSIITKPFGSSASRPLSCRNGDADLMRMGLGTLVVDEKTLWQMKYVG